MNRFASRAGEKLQAALDHFKIDVSGLTVADFGSSTGGFVDCLLHNGAAKVYSVDTAYGELAWKLRSDPRVVIYERENAMHVQLPEKMDLITIDVAWTKQSKVLPNALEYLKPEGKIVSLIKPHYEADRRELKKGRVEDQYLDLVLERVKNDITALGCQIIGLIESPIIGKKGDNKEFLVLIKNASGKNLV